MEFGQVMVYERVVLVGYPVAFVEVAKFSVRTEGSPDMRFLKIPCDFRHHRIEVLFHRKIHGNTVLFLQPLLVVVDILWFVVGHDYL